MKRYTIKARRNSGNDWFPQYTETSVVNGVVVIGNNPQNPSGTLFKTEDEANEETLKILKEQNVSMENIQVVKNK